MQTSSVNKTEMQIELQKKFYIEKGNPNWFAKQIVFWKRKCKLNCKTNSILKKEMNIELQNKFCFEKRNANWIEKQILVLKRK